MRTPLSLPAFLRGHKYLLLGLILGCFLCGSAGASDITVATIIVKGLDDIDREQLLRDLGIDEGYTYYPRLVSDIEKQGRRLSYLRYIDVRCQVIDGTAHLHLTVRMQKRIVIAPVITIGTDGDLSGGFNIQSRSLLHCRESWDIQAIAGGYTLIGMRMKEFKPWSDNLPGLNLELGLEDWSQPFWDPTQDIDERRKWALIGPSFRLPRAGRLLLLGGFESLETIPAVGYSEEGLDEYGLFKLSLRQPLLPNRLNLLASGKLRTPEGERGHLQGDVTLEAFYDLGRWNLEGRLKGGLVNAWAPVTSLYYMGSWDILHAYPCGERPAREFVSFRARGDIPFFSIPIKTRRNGPEADLVFSAFLLAEGANFRLNRTDDFESALDWGVGISAAIPIQPPMRISAGTIWGEDDESRQILMVENR
ncbi:MAG: hypothetical protein GY835_06870 [bacterium]|nr:hypothetical protein [bacterium]